MNETEEKTPPADVPASKLAFAGSLVQGTIIGGLAGGGLVATSFSLRDVNRHSVAAPASVLIAAGIGAVAGAANAWAKREEERKAAVAKEQAPAR